MRLALALLAGSSLLLGATHPAPPRAVAARPVGDDSAIAALSQRYVRDIARFTPTGGTTLGDHRFDDRLEDVSAAGRARTLAHDRSLLADLARIDRKALSRENQVDAALLDNALRYEIWQIETLRDWSWVSLFFFGFVG